MNASLKDFGPSYWGNLLGQSMPDDAKAHVFFDRNRAVVYVAVRPTTGLAQVREHPTFAVTLDSALGGSEALVGLVRSTDVPWTVMALPYNLDRDPPPVIRVYPLEGQSGRPHPLVAVVYDPSLHLGDSVRFTGVVLTHQKSTQQSGVSLGIFDVASPHPLERSELAELLSLHCPPSPAWHLGVVSPRGHPLHDTIERVGDMEPILPLPGLAQFAGEFTLAIEKAPTASVLSGAMSGIDFMLSGQGRKKGYAWLRLVREPAIAMPPLVRVNEIKSALVIYHVRRKSSAIGQTVVVYSQAPIEGYRFMYDQLTPSGEALIQPASSYDRLRASGQRGIAVHEIGTVGLGDLIGVFHDTARLLLTTISPQVPPRPEAAVGVPLWHDAGEAHSDLPDPANGDEEHEGHTVLDTPTRQPCGEHWYVVASPAFVAIEPEDGTHLETYGMSGIIEEIRSHAANELTRSPVAEWVARHVTELIREMGRTDEPARYRGYRQMRAGLPPEEASPLILGCEALGSTIRLDQAGASALNRDLDQVHTEAPQFAHLGAMAGSLSALVPLRQPDGSWPTLVYAVEVLLGLDATQKQDLERLSSDPIAQAHALKTLLGRQPARAGTSTQAPPAASATARPTRSGKRRPVERRHP